MSKISRSHGFILHSRRYRENSRILEVFTETAGKIALIARVSKKKSSRDLPALQPLTESLFQWRGSRDLQYLDSADPNCFFRLNGDRGLCALYCNELLLYLSERHLPMPELYACYRSTLVALERESESELKIPLRLFESGLLAELGYSFDCSVDSASNEIFAADAGCFFHPETGFSTNQQRADSLKIDSQQRIMLAEKKFTHPQVIAVSRKLFGVMINYLLAGKTLKSRQLMQSLYKIRNQK